MLLGVIFDDLRRTCPDLSVIQHGFEPPLLVPIGTGIIIGNIPIQLDGAAAIGIDQEGSVYYFQIRVLNRIIPL